MNPGMDVMRLKKSIYSDLKTAPKGNVDPEQSSYIICFIIS